MTTRYPILIDTSDDLYQEWIEIKWIGVGKIYLLFRGGGGVNEPNEPNLTFLANAYPILGQILIICPNILPGFLEFSSDLVTYYTWSGIEW